VFAKRRTKVAEERSSKKQPLDLEEVKALLASVDEVIVVRGRRAERRPATDVAPDDLRGPTGNFRAPLVRRGRTLLVGYNPEALAALL
jgi:arsenate reductase-like glutaredoxin family protein